MNPIFTAVGSGETTPKLLGTLLGALGWVTAIGEVLVMVVMVAAGTGIIRVDMATQALQLIMTGVEKERERETSFLPFPSLFYF